MLIQYETMNYMYPDTLMVLLIFQYTFSTQIRSETSKLTTHICYRVFYGPGGPYALFAGKDASRALAKMSFEEKDLTGDVSGLGPFELEALQDWEYKFMSKYVKVGTIKNTVPVTDGTSTSEPATQATEGDASKPAEECPSDAAHVETTPVGESKEE